ncbi:hypothetical protein AB1Y20_004501 [Prymnesium parvum]|uniref:Neurotransmitter-gated ion-channel ligand-binding domain-containing protein n=1 Tax=Prymnesium parvum TaxID=97485 RepID=A0AB34IWE5_PRYPA
MFRAAALCYVLLAHACHALDGDFKADANLHMARLRNDLLSQPGFSKNTPPTSNRSASGTDYSESGTDIRMQIRFFKVMEVSASSGFMRLRIWLRLYWSDTRLSWNPADYGNLTHIYFQGMNYPGSEDCEIWVPDVQPFNANNGLVNTLEPAAARVDYKGEVFFSRPGTLDVLCRFSGLVAFPYDSLSCEIEMGGWSYSGGQMGIQLHDGGYAFSQQERSSGTTYQQYTIQSVDVSLNLYTYDCCPSEPWPVATYMIRLRRADFFYYSVTIIPGVLITFLSFAVFFSDNTSVDPLGYGISVIVVNLLGNLVFINMLPVCGEMIWIDVFLMLNTFFCCISLVQSALSITLEDCENDHFPLFPSWLIFIILYLRDKFKNKLPKWNTQQSRNSGETAQSQVLSNFLNASHVVAESVAGVLYRQRHPEDDDAPEHVPTTKLKVDAVEPDHPKSDPAQSCGDVRAVQGELRTSSRHDPKRTEPKVSRAEVMEKYIFFERLFFLLDLNTSMFVEDSECHALLSFTCLDLDPRDREDIISRHDVNNDRRLNRMEFCRLCADHLMDVPIHNIKVAVENIRDVRSSNTRRNSAYWKKAAVQLDVWSRTIVPAIYVLALGILFNIEFYDEYERKDRTTEMFEGLPPMKLKESGESFIITYFLLALFCATMFTYMRRVVAKQKDARKQAFLHAGTNTAYSLIVSAFMLPFR